MARESTILVSINFGSMEISVAFYFGTSGISMALEVSVVSIV